MERPLADKRPLGPFAQSSPSSNNGLALVYTTSDVSDFPAPFQAEAALEDVYMQRRDEGQSEVVAASVDVDMVGSSSSNTRGIKVTTDVSIMNMGQFDAVKDATDSVMDQFIEYSTVAVAVPNP